MGTSNYFDSQAMSQCLPELPGVPDPMLVSALNNAAIQLCQKAGVWRDTQTITLIANEPTCDFDLPPSSRLRAIEAIKYAGLEIFPKSPTELDYLLPGWQAQVGGPSYYYAVSTDGDPLAIALVPMPGPDQAGKTIVVEASFVPLQNSQTFDSELLERYSDCIANGAKSALMRMPKKPWTDKESAADYEGRYVTAIDEARIEIMHRFTTGSLKARPVAFGSYGSAR